MSAGFIHFFQAPGAGKLLQLHGALLRHGLGLSLHEGVGALCESVQAAPTAIRMPRLVLLAASHELNRQAAAALRRIDSGIFIVALAAQVDDNALLQAMRDGIDACWPAGAPPPSIATGVLRLLGGGAGAGQCVGHGAAAHQPAGFVIHGEAGQGDVDAVPKASPQSGGEAPAGRPEVFTAVGSGWKLLSRAWTVRAPNGAHIELTTTERTLMLALYEAPGRRLSHAEMIRALEQAAVQMPGAVHAKAPQGSQRARPGGLHRVAQATVGDAPGRGGRGDPATRRLGVLMSRLRRKFVEAGLDMPFRSVRGLGYELCVDFDGLAGHFHAVAAVPSVAVSIDAP